MKTNRIPVALYKFALYISSNNDYLHSIAPGATDPRGVVLGMTTAELTTFGTYALKLVSGDAANPGTWELHHNKDTKTMKTRKDMMQIRKEFCVFFRPILNRISGSSAITNGDRITLNIAGPNASRKRPTTPIAEQCYFNITMLGQGKLKLECRSANDSRRAGRPPDANSVEVAFSLQAPLVTLSSVSTASGTQQVVSKPPDPEAGTTRVISSKATFVLNLGTDKVSNTVHLWVRWVNTKYPTLSGIWSAVQSLVLA